jgi:hypothetical protein
MNHKLMNCLAVGALGTVLAFSAPAFARGGFGGGMGGMHSGGMGGMHGGATGGGMRFAAASPQFNGARFTNARFANAAISPRFSSFHHGFHHRFFHHRFNRFAFFGGPFVYAAYDSCWSQCGRPMDCSMSMSARTTGISVQPPVMVAIARHLRLD